MDNHATGSLLHTKVFHSKEGYVIVEQERSHYHEKVLRGAFMEMPEPVTSTAPLIVVVEDDEATREVVQIVIESETPYRTLLIPSGKETLQRLEEVKRARPDLFLLDFQLPFMNALDLYDQLHTIPELRDVPTIIMTASTISDVQQAAIAARHIEIFWKPFEVQDLLAGIEHALHRCQPG